MMLGNLMGKSFVGPNHAAIRSLMEAQNIFCPEDHAFELCAFSNRLNWLKYPIHSQRPELHPVLAAAHKDSDSSLMRQV
jgi:hypothetical protein